MVPRCVAAVLLAGLVLAADAPQKRAMYAVKHADAKGLAEALSKHFKEEVDFQPVPGTNVLLLRGPEAALADAAKLLDVLDRRPKVVAVELLMIDATPKPDDRPLDEKTFTGSVKAVMERIDKLREKGSLGEVRRFQVTTTEGSPSSVVIGSSRPYTSGVSGAPRGGFPKGGPVARSISYREVGTTAKVTARVAADDTIVLELDVQDSRMKDGAPLGLDEGGTPITAPEFVQSTLRATVSVRPGQAVAVKDVVTTSKTSPGRTVVIAIAKVADDDPPKGR